MESFLKQLPGLDSPDLRNATCRDDYEDYSVKTFEILFYLTAVSMLVCLYNGYLMWKSNRIQNNIPLALFFGFSFSTLIVMMVLFGDAYGIYSCCVFNIFMKLPTYTYVSMAYSYMMNW
jgi:hypothetical protein